VVDRQDDVCNVRSCWPSEYQITTLLEEPSFEKKPTSEIIVGDKQIRDDGHQLPEGVVVLKIRCWVKLLHLHYSHRLLQVHNRSRSLFDASHLRRRGEFAVSIMNIEVDSQTSQWSMPSVPTEATTKLVLSSAFPSVLWGCSKLSIFTNAPTASSWFLPKRCVGQCSIHTTSVNIRNQYLLSRFL